MGDKSDPGKADIEVNISRQISRHRARGQDVSSSTARYEVITLRHLTMHLDETLLIKNFGDIYSNCFVTSEESLKVIENEEGG